MKLPEEMQPALLRFIAENDFAWWFTRTKPTKAFDLAKDHMKYRLDRKEFYALLENCAWFTKLTRRGALRGNTLSERNWLDLRDDIKTNLEHLRGRSIHEWVAILNALGRVRVNEYVLRGLMSDLQLWRKEEA